MRNYAFIAKQNKNNAEPLMVFNIDGEHVGFYRENKVPKKQLPKLLQRFVLK